MLARLVRRSTLLVSVSFVFCALFAGFPPPARALVIDLKTFPPDYAVFGASQEDVAAQGVLFADLNGDGRSDMVVGAPGVDYMGRSACGAVYVVYTADTLQSPVDLSTARGDVKVIMGPEANARVGSRIACGNVDGDRYDDLVIGVPTASPNGRFFAGELYVVFGGNVPPDTLDLLTPGQDFIRIQGEKEFDKLGDAISAGDVNNDDFADIIAGAPFATVDGRQYAGEVFVIYGDSGLPGDIDLALPVWAGIRIFGSEGNDTFGTACYSADVTNDNVDDIIVGAPEAAPVARSAAGVAYVIRGGASLPDTIDTLDENGSLLSRILGASPGALTGSGFGSADVDGDLLTDFLVGAPELSPNGRTAAGSVYSLSGSVGLPDTVDLAAPPAGTVRIDGPTANSKIGRRITAGDYNFDAADDVVIGAPSATFQVAPEPQSRISAGSVYIIFGRQVFAPEIDLSVAQTGITTILGAASLENTGTSVATGRMNADPFDDLLIGADGVARGGKFNVGRGLVLLGNAAITPTFVVFYDASATPGSVRVEWELLDDVGSESIDVLRSAGSGDMVKLPSRGLSRIGAGRFIYEDSDVRGGATYSYTAILRDAGSQTLFTVTVTVPRLAGAVLHPGFPNPFRDATTLAFDIPDPGRVTIRVYDVRGALVASIVDRHHDAGSTRVEWNGRDGNGEPAPSGVYFARMSYSGRTLERKLLLLR
jgi:hypothetical protein